MILVAYRRTEAGARLRAAERGRPLVMELPAPKVQPEPVVAPEPPQRPARPARVVRLITPRDHYHWIMDLVARMHGSTFKAIMCRTRVPKHSRARQAAVCAVREAFPDITVPHLGRVFGLDHSTLYNSFRKRGYQERRK